MSLKRLVRSILFTNIGNVRLSLSQLLTFFLYIIYNLRTFITQKMTTK